MNNIVQEKPSDQLHGRTLFSTNFVDNQDISGKDILNIGCGYGWFEFNMLAIPFSSIHGIEISEKDLETAKNNIKSDKVFFKVGSAINIPFENNKFDTIVSFEVIEHIPKNTESKMFFEANRVLKNGGCFYLSTPFSSFFAAMFDPAFYFGHRHYNKEILAKFAVDNGFVVENCLVRGGSWEIIGQNNMYISKWIFRRKPFFIDFIRKMQDKEYLKSSGFTNIFVKFRKIKDL